MESAKLIAGLARIVRDVGVAEDLAQDALLAALERWPVEDGDGEVELELRELYEADDFGDEFTADIQRQDALLREQAGRSAS